ncbi:hypothetical protein UJ101_02553 [Flavobacteriaceae bacterium UJ101]|nr:hypothetical protein UJ101_02553 [Flavobacteriaceae bacterium UJ101]
MKKIFGIKTRYGIIKGRDGIYLDSIVSHDETKITFEGEFNTDLGFKKYTLKFSGIVYLQSIELDFCNKIYMESFCVIEDSTLIKRFKKLNHSNKLNENHKHYYFQTYDTVFEIVADHYDLTY